MQTFESFMNLIMRRIDEIDKAYKNTKGAYEPTPEERKLKAFIEDIWTLRFEDESLNDKMKNASVQMMFISKENPNNVFSKNWKLGKVAPKGKRTTPLWYLIAKLSEDNREFDFFLCPNIFIRTKGNLDNYERNICASNCYFVDIDEVHTDKPIYNCTEEEIKEYLNRTYPFLKECGFSYCLMSGRGLHLYISLKHTEYLIGTKHWNHRRMKHRKTTERLIKVLEADTACKNLNRVLRAPLSVNRKINIRTRFFVQEENRKKYSRDMINEYLLPYEEQTEKECKKEGHTQTKKTDESKWLKREYSEAEKEAFRERALLGRKMMFTNRKEDLEKWFVLHKMDMVGKRHYFFVIYSIVLRELGWSMEAIENRCFSMNQSLPDRLSESELLKHITQRHKYRFRNETIADWLNFTQSEIATFKCNYSEEDMLEHRREKSRQQREAKREQQLVKKEANEKKIFELIKENETLSMSELATLLSCSKATAWRWFKKYQKVKEAVA